MRLLCAAGIFLISCATASSGPNPAAGKVSADPKGAKEAVGGEVGFFPLPKALAGDPTRLKIPPLDFKVLKPERLRLSNGLTLYLAPDPTAPLVRLHAMVAAGTLDDPPERLGQAELTFELMSAAGTRQLDADQLDELLEFHAADANGGASEEYATLNMDLRSEDLPKLFPVFVEMILHPRFQKNRFEVAVSRAVEAVRRRPDSPDGLAARALRKAVYGPKSPFARERTEGTLKSVKVADLQAFHKQVMVPKATSLLIIGDFDREVVLGLVKQHLGDWNGGERISRTFPSPRPLTRRVIFVPKETAQTKIRISGYGYKRLSPQEYAIRVMNTALGGGLGAGRLFREVRGQKGLAYSAYSVATSGPGGGLFYAGADTKPESTVETTQTLLKILHDVTGPSPLSAQELQIAADMYLNSFVFRFDSPGKIAFEKALLDLVGYPEDYLDTYRQKTAEVNVGSALEAAKALLVPDAFQIVVVGPQDKVGDLSQFGPVTTLSDVEAFQ